MDKKFVITDKNVEEYATKIAHWIKKKVVDANMQGVVLGMSGGIDCSVVARLCQIANINTHLILMPYGDDMKNSKSEKDAIEFISNFEFKNNDNLKDKGKAYFSYSKYNIKPAVDFLTIIENGNNEAVQLAYANVRPRVRMTYLYEYAQINSFFVIGTGNLSERTIGYFTKWGDGACDINPIGNLTKGEIYVLAKYLKVPESIINKKPSAGLWEGQTDEDELGMTYEQIDNYILHGSSNIKKVDNIIKRKMEYSKHKLVLIPIFDE